MFRPGQTAFGFAVLVFAMMVAQTASAFDVGMAHVAARASLRDTGANAPAAYTDEHGATRIAPMPVTPMRQGSIESAPSKTFDDGVGVATDGSRHKNDPRKGDDTPSSEPAVIAHAFVLEVPVLEVTPSFSPTPALFEREGVTRPVERPPTAA